MIDNEILAENNLLNDSEFVHDDQIHFNSTSISSDLNNLPCPNIDSVDRKDYLDYTSKDDERQLILKIS